MTAAASPAPRRPAQAASSAALVGALLAVAAASWVATVCWSTAMSMPERGASLAGGAAFVAQWGVMMAAMMLPSAIPMIVLYRTVSRRLSAQGDRAIPPWLFASAYLVVWLATGVPVYLGSVGLKLAADHWARVAAGAPYAIAAALVLAGGYQMTSAKRACLEHCESPLGFLVGRWRSGYAATLRLAGMHAAYCVGCCWALMVILVVVGAMSLPWVAAITLIVFSEKILPRGWRTARLVGVGLMLLGAAVAIRPGLAGKLGPAAMMGGRSMPR